jgi:isoquinoline 1-oxidoreductase beta subunit
MTTKITVSRRQFLASTGAVGFAFVLPSFAASNSNTSASLRPNAWVRIQSDGGIVIQSGISELGQGSMTSLALVVAEELDADWNKVRIEMSPAVDELYGNPRLGNLMVTIASFGVMGYYTALRLAGAKARASLMQAVADSWKVPLSELETEPSVVVHRASKRRMTYGQIAKTVRSLPQPPDLKEADLKPAARFRLVGKDVQRRDLPAKIAGTADYAMNARLPNLAYATILRTPVLGAAAEQVDDAGARAIPGYVGVRKLADAVAVIGNTMESALAARERVSVTWGAAPADSFNDREAIVGYFGAVRNVELAGRAWDKKGEVSLGFDGAAKTLEREYRSDYFYHAQIEPLNATAFVDGGRAEVWAGTQAPAYAVRAVAAALGIDASAVTIHRSYAGGAFGRRAAFDQDFVVDAAVLSRDLARPVKVIWSRQEDVRSGRFKPMTAQWMKAALDQGGNVTGWRHRIACEDPLMMADPPRSKARKESPAVAMLGSDIPTYDVPNRLVEHLRQPIVVRIAPMRGVGAPPNRFAVESFVDEVALEAGVDPLEMRRRLLRNTPRGLRVLERVVQMSGWGRAEPNRAKGLAFSDYDGTMLAAVAEVSVERTSGVIRVHNIWAVADPGLVLQPDNSLALIEGGLIFGTSMALKERITFSKGRVEQTSFDDYPVLRMNEAPDLHVELMPSEGPPTGLGEIAPIIAPAAIGNAFAALTGKRVRHLPMIPERVRAAMS